jgi:Asp-tRNA(Asn)/Glu-tRNA(Gln) amidotransferase B subunit
MTKRSMPKLTKLDPLNYARNGVLMEIGSYPVFHEYPEEVEAYRRDLAEIERRIKLVRARKQRSSP